MEESVGNRVEYDELKEQEYMLCALFSNDWVNLLHCIRGKYVNWKEHSQKREFFHLILNSSCSLIKSKHSQKEYNRQERKFITEKRMINEFKLKYITTDFWRKPTFNKCFCDCISMQNQNMFGIVSTGNWNSCHTFKVWSKYSFQNWIDFKNKCYQKQ